jgi:UDP-N-acetylglucosamine--N-acetylmuramyl-(pentapeptide) pyrophosphoryl-undecaprenol N-acetylglucosamine transferase
MSVGRAPLVLIMAGGTGGHVYPALAVATELVDRGCRVEWVGTHRGLEARVVPEAGITLHYLLVRGVRGKNPLWKILGLLVLLLSTLQALWLVLRLSPQCVVGMGGYVAGPAGVAAWVLRKPLVIHEQNAVAGTTNRLLAPFASRILAGFPGAFKTEREYAVVGNPVRRELLQRAAAAGHYDFAAQRPLRLLVLGGSLGAKPINELVPDAVEKLIEARGEEALEVRHQSGELHLESVVAAYGSSLEKGVQVAAFIEDMASAYEWADLVLCRSGALTVSELSIMGRPALLVPLPHAIDDHQSANAGFLSGPGGGVLLRQDKLTAGHLKEVLTVYLDSPQDLVRMAEISAGLGIPGATNLVCDCCEELINEHG